MSDEWIGIEALAEELGIPVRTVYAWRSASPRKGPRGHKLGKHVRFRRVDVEEWLASQAEVR